MRHFLKVVVEAMARLLPRRLLFPVARSLVHAKALALEPESRMRELLLLQNFLANELADAGQALGGGSHVKHELMGYHEFFAQRIGSEDRVLDVGCGGGELSAEIARATGASVVGVERDAAHVARAEKACMGLPVDIIQADVLDWQAPGRVTVIVLSNVLEHLTRRPEFLARLFGDTGASKALIRVPLYEREWTVPMRQRLGMEWRLDTTHETEYRVPQFLEEMRDAGCRVVEMDIRWSEIWAVVAPERPGGARTGGAGTA